MLRERKIGDAPSRLLEQLVLRIFDEADDLQVATPLASADGDSSSDWVLIGEEPLRQKLVDDDDAGTRR